MIPLSGVTFFDGHLCSCSCTSLLKLNQVALLMPLGARGLPTCRDLLVIFTKRPPGPHWPRGQRGNTPPSLSCVVPSYFIHSTQHHRFRAQLWSPTTWIYNFTLFLSKSSPCLCFCFLFCKMTTVLAPVSSSRGEG